MPYTETDHDRALGSLASDLDQSMTDNYYKVKVNTAREHHRKDSRNCFAGIVRAANADEALAIFRRESGVSCWRSFCAGGGSVQAVSDGELGTKLGHAVREFTGGWQTYHDMTIDEVFKQRPFDKECDGDTITLITPWRDDRSLRFE